MSEKKRTLGSDLQKIDAHVITPEEYEEIPSTLEIWFQMLCGRTPLDSTFRVAGVRNQTGEPDTMPSENTVHIAIELSFSSWLVAVRLPGAKKSALHRIEGGNTGALLALIAKLRSRTLTKLGRAVEVACCFEAGRDGFWLHRLLTAHGPIGLCAR